MGENNKIPGAKFSRRYDPPTVNNDYNAEWHIKGVCNYLIKHPAPRSLYQKLADMLRKAAHMLFF